MNEEITKLDDKYLVLKWSDIRNLLSMEERQDLNRLVQFVHFARIESGKVGSKSYLVLNLDDDIDVLDIKHIGVSLLLANKSKVKVKDIAVDLVNAVLKAKKG